MRYRVQPTETQRELLRKWLQKPLPPDPDKSFEKAWRAIDEIKARRAAKDVEAGE